jgi:excisionase family DNA binding protein
MAVPEQLTTAEAAAALQVTRRRVQELIRLGTLKAKKRGRDWMIDPASVEAYKNSPRKAGRPWPKKSDSEKSNVANSVADLPRSTENTAPERDP